MIVRNIIYRTLVLSGAVVFLMTYMNSAVMADSQSSHYLLRESVVGGSGYDYSQSANFQSLLSSGVLGTDTSTGTNYQVNNGPQTTDDPALSFAVDTPTIDFGAFSAGSATVATSTFEVSDFTSYGYIVQIVGSAPTDSVSGHVIAGMSTTGTSQTGTDQFGINLVANTSPVSVGANPDHGQFGFGSASSNYGTANNYRYVSGETIASAPKSSGLTVYTISYLVNVSSLTPAGQYVTNQTIICTGTY